MSVKALAFHGRPKGGGGDMEVKAFFFFLVSPRAAPVLIYFLFYLFIFFAFYTPFQKASYRPVFEFCKELAIEFVHFFFLHKHEIWKREWTLNNVFNFLLLAKKTTI